MDTLDEISCNKINKIDTRNNYIKKFILYSGFVYFYATDNITNLPQIVLFSYAYGFFCKCLDTNPLLTY